MVSPYSNKTVTKTSRDDRVLGPCLSPCMHIVQSAGHRAGGEYSTSWVSSLSEEMQSCPPWQLSSSGGQLDFTTLLISVQ